MCRRFQVTPMNSISDGTFITQTHALRIAESDAVIVYRDLTPYEVEIQLEADGWHIEYHLKPLPGSRFMTGGGPHYIIDASTGAILDKKYYQ
jgi:hypothetical protein